MDTVAIALATAANFILGFIWYSGVFGDIWQEETGITYEQMKAQGASPFIISVFYSLLAAFGFGTLMDSITSLHHAIGLGLTIGILCVATSLGINYQFAGKSNKLFAVDAGYHIVQFVIYAFIFWYLR